LLHCKIKRPCTVIPHNQISAIDVNLSSCDPAHPCQEYGAGANRERKQSARGQQRRSCRLIRSDRKEYRTDRRDARGVRDLRRSTVDAPKWWWPKGPFMMGTPAGAWNYLLKVRVVTTRDLERFLGETVKAVDGVERTETLITLSSAKGDMEGQSRGRAILTAQATPHAACRERRTNTGIPGRGMPPDFARQPCAGRPASRIALPLPSP
jgi:Lrp/AsnC ligand binding domain